MADALLLDQEASGTVVTLLLTAQRTDGTGIIAADCVSIVGAPAPPGVLAVQANVPGVFVDATPPDVILDDGGFTFFERSYPIGTMVILTAPLVQEGLVFEGWIVEQQSLPFPWPSPMILVVVEGDRTEIVARYRQRSFDSIGTPGPASH